MFHIYIWKWSKLLDEDLLALLVSLLLNERTNKKHARHNNSGFLKTHQHKLWGDFWSLKTSTTQLILRSDESIKLCAFVQENRFVQYKGDLKNGYTLAISVGDSVCNFESQCF